MRFSTETQSSQRTTEFHRGKYTECRGDLYGRPKTTTAHSQAPLNSPGGGKFSPLLEGQGGGSQRAESPAYFSVGQRPIEK